MGVYPQPFLRRMDRSVDAIMLRVQSEQRLHRDQGIEQPSPGEGWDLRNRELGVKSGHCPSSPLATLAASRRLSPTAYCPTAYCLSAGGGR